MADLNPHDDLVQHLSRLLGIAPEQARRAVLEVLDYYREPIEDYVVRRHRELQGSGIANPAAFERIRGEIAAGRYPAPALSTRQIRRMIYG